LANCKQQVCILIDDARLFTAPPPIPNDYRQYPCIQQIVNAFNDDVFITIYADVIIIVPAYLKDTCQQYLQTKTTTDWLEYAKEIKRNQPGVLKNMLRKLKNKIINRK